MRKPRFFSRVDIKLNGLVDQTKWFRRMTFYPPKSLTKFDSCELFILLENKSNSKPASRGNAHCLLVKLNPKNIIGS